jgi:hypothetical protein
MGCEVVVVEALVMNGGECPKAGKEDLNDQEDAERVREGAVKGANASRSSPAGFTHRRRSGFFNHASASSRLLNVPILVPCSSRM